MVGGTPNGAVDFLLVLGAYYLERIKEAWGRIAAGVNPWQWQSFVSGMAGVLYLFGVVLFLALLLFDGFGRHSRRNCAFLVVIAVCFVLSFLRGQG